MTDHAKPGPRALPVVYTCTGCPALRVDRTTLRHTRHSAHCADDSYQDGRRITDFWTDNSPAPDWCPHKETP